MELEPGAKKKVSEGVDTRGSVANERGLARPACGRSVHVGEQLIAVPAGRSGGKVERTSPSQAILFDFDLTLANSTAGVVECVGYALRELGLPPADRTSILRTVGLSLPRTLEC
jgi:hypothetical protein